MFEEDNIENLRICLSLAPRHCDACNDFHLAVAVRRSADNHQMYGIDFDRQLFGNMIANALEIRRDLKAPLTVLIAGAADTAILKTTLDSAVKVGGEAFARRLEITVVDLCQTPLEMCGAFVTRHGLRIETKRTDLGDFEPTGRFGIIVMHGVLPFFPLDRRLSYMTRIVSWLDTNGLVVSSSQIAETSQSEHVEKEIGRHKTMLGCFLDSQTAPIIVDRDEMFARLRRAVNMRESHPRVFEDEEELHKFYSTSGLHLRDCQTVKSDNSSASKRYTHRVIVLGEVSE